MKKQTQQTLHTASGWAAAAAATVADAASARIQFGKRKGTGGRGYPQIARVQL